jgi:hypothetical protein
MGFSRWGVLIGVIVTIAIIAAVVMVFRAAINKDEESSLSKAFTYDLEELRKTDPALIKYEEIDNIQTGFEEVYAIAIDSSHRIYVAGDKAIKVFHSDGYAISEIGLPESPRCLTVVENGTLYVGMPDHIEVYNQSGTRVAKWESAGENALLTSVAVYGEDVWVANARERVVLRYDTSGKLIKRIGEKDMDRNIPGFIIPSPYFDLAVAPDGLLRVTNPGLQRVEAYTFDGDLEIWWGKPANSIDGFVGCCNPVNFAILPDGRFVTCEKGIPRVKVYSDRGVFESVVAGAELFETSDEAYALDVAVDSQGRVLVLDPERKSIRIFGLIDKKE